MILALSVPGPQRLQGCGQVTWGHCGPWQGVPGEGGAIPEPAQGGRWQFHTAGHSIKALSVCKKFLTKVLL